MSEWVGKWIDGWMDGWWMDWWAGKHNSKEPGYSKSAEEGSELRPPISVFSLTQHQTSENQVECFPHSLNWTKCFSSSAHGILSITLWNKFYCISSCQSPHMISFIFVSTPQKRKRKPRKVKELALLPRRKRWGQALMLRAHQTNFWPHLIKR